MKIQRGENEEILVTPSEDCDTSYQFRDFQSGLIVHVEIKRAVWPHQLPETRQYVIHPDTLKVLSSDERKEFFSYEQPWREFSADGRLECVLVRTHDANTGADSIEHVLTDAPSGAVLSSGRRSALLRTKPLSPIEDYYRAEEEQRSYREGLELGEYPEELYRQRLGELNDQDLVALYYDSDQVYGLKFEEGVFRLWTASGADPNEAWETDKHVLVGEFSEPEDFFAYLNKEENWYELYSPLPTFKAMVLGKYIFGLGNTLRFQGNLSRKQFLALGEWETAIFDDQLSPAAKHQFCAHCRKRIPYQPLSPKRICTDCEDLLTDADGRFVAFVNGERGPDCTGYYRDVPGEEDYSSNIGFIGKQTYLALPFYEGIVIEAKD